MFNHNQIKRHEHHQRVHIDYTNCSYHLTILLITMEPQLFSILYFSLLFFSRKKFALIPATITIEENGNHSIKGE